MKAISDCENNIFIDGLSLAVLPQFDALITDLIESINHSIKGPNDIVVTFKNMGAQHLTSCDINYNINEIQGTFNVAEGEGTISASVSDTSIISVDYIIEGSDVILNTSPANGFNISAWLINDIEIDTELSDSYTITTISDITDVKVKFEITDNINLSTNNSDIKTYPNPVKNKVIINISNTPNNTLYNIYSISGDIIVNGSINNDETIIGMSQVIKGIYFFTIRSKWK